MDNDECSRKLPVSYASCPKINNQAQDRNRKIQLSKAISWLLRHGAREENLTITSDGFVEVEDLLKHKRFRGKCYLKDIVDIVITDPKKRFALRTNISNGTLEIRANQGHSMKELPDLELTPITRVDQLPNTWVVHGTYHKSVPSIRQKGLSRMSRIHIHLSPYEPGDQRVISGLRCNVEALVYIDVAKALADGIKFYRSANDVILTEGNPSGFIEPKYFLNIKDIKTGHNLL